MKNETMPRRIPQQSDRVVDKKKGGLLKSVENDEVCPGTECLKVSIVEMLNRWNFQEADSFFLQNDLLLGSRCPLYISLLGFPVMNFQGLCGKLGSHIFEMLVQDLLNCLKCAACVLFSSFSLPALNHRKRRIDPFNPPVATDGAIDNARGFLFLEGCAILEPAFEYVFVRTDEIVCNHPSLD
jgi:hypothetical protein